MGDFVCGADVARLCGDTPKALLRRCIEHNRDRLARPCHDHLIEVESLYCGIEIERVCHAAKHEGREAFEKCLREHYVELKKICPETLFDKFDRDVNIACGEAVEGSCHDCEDRECLL